MGILAPDDDYFMGEALREARKAEAEGEIPVGAVVVCNDTVIARAHNQTEMLHDVTAHAEMLAFTAASEGIGAKYLTDCTLYVTVEPCLMCAGALAWSQISRIVYGASDDKRGYHTQCASPFHPKTTVTAGVLADECGKLMTDFFKKKRPIKK